MATLENHVPYDRPKLSKVCNLFFIVLCEEMYALFNKYLICNSDIFFGVMTFRD